MLYVNSRFDILPKMTTMADKVKIQLEYIINCSPKVLFNRLSTASGLAEWFADDVRVKGDKYTFIWDGTEQLARMTLYKENKLIRFNWIDSDGYFEFRITQDELTNDVSLIVIDFTLEDEKEDTTELWNTQIEELRHVLGS
jgi:uncharacterized protein YndB with AHSA1/START domain